MPVPRKLKAQCAQYLKNIEGLSAHDRDMIMGQVQRFINFEQGSTTAGLSAEISKYARKLRDDHESMIINRTMLELKNLVIEKDVLERISDFTNDPVEGVLALIRGSNQQIRGARNSIDVHQKALLKRYAGGLLNDLQEAGLLNLFRGGKNDREIMQSFYEQAAGRKYMDNPEVAQLTEIMHKWDNVIMNRLNAAGAQIEKDPGFLFRMSHDRTKIHDVGFNKWMHESKDFFDRKAMEKNLEVSYEEFMRGIYDDLATGKFLMAAADGESNIPIGYTATNANLAKRVSTKNRLKFKDGNSHYDYLQKFGDSSAHIRESVLFSFEHSGRNIGLMETLGPNPKNMIKKVLGKKMTELHRNNKDLFIEQFGDMVGDLPRSINNAFKEVDGTSRIPGNPTAASVASKSRILANVALLGNILLKSVNDFATIISEAKYQGIGWGKALKIHFDAMNALVPSSEQKQFGKILGIGQETLMSDVIGTFNTTDLLPGGWSRLQRFYFKANGISFWNDALKSSFAMMQAVHLGEHAGLSLTQIKGANPNLARMLKTFDIDAADWQMLSSTSWADDKSRTMITPDKIDELHDDVIARYLDIKGVEPDDQIITQFGIEMRDLQEKITARQRDEFFDFDKTKLAEIDERVGEIAHLEELFAKEGKKEIDAIAQINRDEDTISGATGLDRTSREGTHDIIQEAKKSLKKHQKLREKATKRRESLSTKMRKKRQKLATINPKIRFTKDISGGVGVATSKYSADQINRARNRLSQKLQSVYQDRNDFAVLIPGARERAAFNRGHQPGTAIGEAMRFIAQFKTFPLSVFTRPLERDILAGGAKTIAEGLNFLGPKGGDMLALAGFIGGMTVYSGIGLMATDALVHQRTQRDWTDPKSIFDAMASGGALGLYSDIVLAPYSHNDNFVNWKTAVGPVAGQFETISDIISGAIKGDNVSKKLLNLAHTFTPGANLFYSRKAMEYLVWHQLQENFDPGSLRRKERALEKRTGQTYFNPPSEDF